MANAVVTVVGHSNLVNSIKATSSQFSNAPSFRDPTYEVMGAKYFEFFERHGSSSSRMHDNQRLIDAAYWDELRRTVFAQRDGICFSRRKVNLGGQAPYALHLFGDERSLYFSGILSTIKIAQYNKVKSKSVDDLRGILGTYLRNTANDAGIDLFEPLADMEPISILSGNRDF